MKFGQKPTVKSRMAAADARLGKTTGASKGNTVKPKTKVTPSGTNPLKGKIGIKIKKTF
jgi:hypothetical protein